MKQDKIECIITGCGLLTDEGYAWGDLWAGGQVYVFNGVCEEGTMNWQIEPQPYHKVIRVPSGGAYFERRGVAVIPKEVADFNEAARDYITTPRP